MKRTISILIGLFMLLSMCVLYAQENKEGKAKAPKQADVPRISGTIKAINKDTSTITVKTRTADRQVVYNNDTQYTKTNKPGAKFEDLQEGVRIIAIGKFEGLKLNASRIDIRGQ